MAKTRRSARLSSLKDNQNDSNDTTDKKINESTNNRGKATMTQRSRKRKSTPTKGIRTTRSKSKRVTRSCTKKSAPRIKIATTDNSMEYSPKNPSKRRKKSSEPRRPNTRSSRKRIASLVVTPSPAPGRRDSMEYSSPSSSNSWKPILSFDEESSNFPVPEGVRDIDQFPPCCHRRRKTYFGHSPCNCIHQIDHNHSSTLSERYLYTYGRDYDKYLQETQQEPFHNDPSLASLSVISGMREHDESEWEFDPYSSSDDSTVSSLSMSPSIRCHFATVKPLPVVPNIPATSVLENYMKRQTDLSPEMRGILIDWLIELTEEYTISPKTFHLAVALVDRSLAAITFDRDNYSKTASKSGSKLPHRGFLVKRDHLQCVGCACMLVASKLEETSGPSVDDFVYISDSSYTRKEITKMELKICTALKFHLRYITPYDFVDRFLRASHVSSFTNQSTPTFCCAAVPVYATLQYMVEYLLELAAMQYELVAHPPSEIAAAAVFLARVILGIYDHRPKQKNQPPAYWSRTLAHYTEYELYDIEEVTLVIYEALSRAEKSDLRSVFTKYKSSKYNRVSLKTVPPKEKLGFHLLEIM